MSGRECFRPENCICEFGHVWNHGCKLDPDNQESDDEMEDEIVQYFIVNSDFKMSKGKVAAQVAHAETLFIMNLFRVSSNGWDEECYDWFQKWYHKGSMTKVVLKANTGEMEKISESCDSVVVIDEGRTEIPSGTMTVVGLLPMPKSIASKYVGDLKLLS